MKLLVAIPALNEELSIASVISEVKKHLVEATVLVIDDGSSDSTAAIAKNSGAIVLSMPFNVGVGGALRAAFKFALENGYTHLIQIDADGQHLPSETRKILEASTEDCIVIGSRFQAKDENKNYRVELFRKLAMRILAFSVSKICRTPLTDVTSGFRLATGKAIKTFAEKYPRDYLGDTVESLVIAHRAGIKILEVPVTMSQRKFGTPSQNLLKSTWYLTRIFVALMIYTISSDKSE